MRNELTDKEFLSLAIDNSKRSMEEGNFPAGALVVKDGVILTSMVSSSYPGLFHSDSKAISEAFDNVGLLTGATLYIGLESCLMCTSLAYWSGLRRIVFAIPKAKVSRDYYETPEDTRSVFKKFNEQIEFIHISELEEEALEVVNVWEKNNNN